MSGCALRMASISMTCGFRSSRSVSGRRPPCLSVAENRSDWRAGLLAPMMLSTSAAKPRSSMRSASSSTRKPRSPRSASPVCKCSNNRPGVAMTRSGFLRNAATWRPRSSPPMMTATVSRVRLPRLRNSAWIWRASSRVGTSTSARIAPSGAGVSMRRCRIGSRKAPVLPEPVAAEASRSRPSSTAGITRCWTGVGCCQPALAMARCSGSSRSKASK